LDKELVRLVEERKAKEAEENRKKAAVEKANIKVKPIVETVPPPPPSTTSVGTPSMTLDEKVNDLLRFTPPPKPTNSTEIPAKLQQMNGPSGPIRKSTKAKW